ncbi:MAG: C10 family peptidase, partial [Muribaculaceae bacterium]|nr:C10 family peptidase [Muribaculaceae bacterium]
MKKILTLAGMLAMSAVLSASPLTPEQALKRAQANSPRLKKAATAAPSASFRLSYSLSTPAGEPALYVFDYPASAGYMIVSADDAAAPVLGYADSGNFDSENIPPQMAWWLSQYAAGIEYASEKGIKASATTRSSKAAVAPLMKTKWNQGTPYNDLCPSVNSVRCPSGCVATAMAQVMKYHNYPDVGTGRVVATLPQGQGVTGDPYINLASKPFDWDNMLDEYSGYSYTTAQATAVATLMQAAGYASKMSYGVKGSGALSLNAAMALSKNFKYNPNIQYLQRNYFNASDWGEIIYKELAAGRPVMYGGQSTSVGHEFVCDGYDGNGYY